MKMFLHDKALKGMSSISSSAEKNIIHLAHNRNKHLVHIMIFLLVIVGAMFAFIIYKMETQPAIVLSGSPTVKLKTQTELKQLIEQEKQNPATYLRNNAFIRSNIFGKRIIKGSIRNIASTIAYKDITIQVSFIARTKDTLGNKNFILYETIKPGQNISYKFKTDAPDSTVEFAINVIHAGAAGF